MSAVRAAGAGWEVKERVGEETGFDVGGDLGGAAVELVVLTPALSCPEVVEEGGEGGVGELSKLRCCELGCDGRWGGGDGSPDVAEGGGVESEGCGVVVAEEGTFVGVGYRAAWA